MRKFVFFLEEKSAKEMLEGLLPKILPTDATLQFVVFEGKQDLEKQLPIKLRAWRDPAAIRFIVLRDQDSGDCKTIKQGLVATCVKAGKPNSLVRIACHELEAFYLGDLDAVAQATGLTNLGRQQQKTKFRDPDKLIRPSQELKKLVPEYQKVAGSRAIGRCLTISNNKSQSFNALVAGIQKLIGKAA